MPLNYGGSKTLTQLLPKLNEAAQALAAQKTHTPTNPLSTNPPATNACQSLLGGGS